MKEERFVSFHLVTWNSPSPQIHCHHGVHLLGVESQSLGSILQSGVEQSLVWVSQGTGSDLKLGEQYQEEQHFRQRKQCLEEEKPAQLSNSCQPSFQGQHKRED